MSCSLGRAIQHLATHVTASRAAPSAPLKKSCTAAVALPTSAVPHYHTRSLPLAWNAEPCKHPHLLLPLSIDHAPLDAPRSSRRGMISRASPQPGWHMHDGIVHEAVYDKHAGRQAGRHWRALSSWASQGMATHLKRDPSHPAPAAAPRSAAAAAAPSCCGACRASGRRRPESRCARCAGPAGSARKGERVGSMGFYMASQSWSADLDKLDVTYIFGLSTHPADMVAV